MLDLGWQKALATCVGACLAFAASPAQAAQLLHGWECKGTVAEFASTGSMQRDRAEQRGAWAPPVPVYAGPRSAVRTGGGNGVILVRKMPPQNGRVEVLLPNGHRGWVEAAQLVPWRTRCQPALLDNGRYGFVAK